MFSYEQRIKAIELYSKCESWTTTIRILGYSMTMSERILIMVKNKVVLKERDAWSNLANFIGEMVAKYSEAMDLDSLPDPDHYLLMKRIKQLYVEFYKPKNIVKFRNTKISIERKAVA